MRDFQGIIAGILRCAFENEGITKIGITNEMRLSFTQIKKYLQLLLVYYGKISTKPRRNLKENKGN